MIRETVPGTAAVVKDGKRELIDWNPETRVIEPEMVDLILNDMWGDEAEMETEEDKKTREVTRSFLIKLVKGWNELTGNPAEDGYQAGQLTGIAWGFVAGYEAALHGKVEIP